MACQWTPSARDWIRAVETAADHAGASRGNNWMLIAACVTLLFAGVVGGVFYFRPQSANSGAIASAPKVELARGAAAAGISDRRADSRSATPDVRPAHNSATHPVLRLSAQSNAPAATCECGMLRQTALAHV